MTRGVLLRTLGVHRRFHVFLFGELREGDTGAEVGSAWPSEPQGLRLVRIVTARTVKEVERAPQLVTSCEIIGLLGATLVFPILADAS